MVQCGRVGGEPDEPAHDVRHHGREPFVGQILRVCEE